MVNNTFEIASAHSVVVRFRKNGLTSKEENICSQTHTRIHKQKKVNCCVL